MQLIFMLFIKLMVFVIIFQLMRRSQTSLLFHHFNLTEEVIFLVHACISNGIEIMYFLECLYIFG
jgi:hypothetical protein